MRLITCGLIGTLIGHAIVAQESYVLVVALVMTVVELADTLLDRDDIGNNGPTW